MASITKIHLMQLPNWQRSGTQQGVQQAVWHVETDAVYPSGYVMAIAQGLTGSFTGDAVGSNLVPVRNNVLAMDNGDIVPGITFATVASWVGAGNDRYADGGAYALEEQCQPLEEGPTKSHRITIGFRAPQPGRLERPGFLTNFASGIGTTFPTPPTSTTAKPVPTTAEIVTALDVTNQPVEFHVEYRTETVEEQRGYPIRFKQDNSVQILDLTPLRNPLGEPYPARFQNEWVQIVTAERIVGTDVFAHQMNRAWKNTMNGDQITFQSQIIPPYHARWAGAETSRPRTEGGTEYKVLTYRVEISDQPYFERIPASGTFYLARSEGPATQGGTLPPLVRTQDKDDEGFPLGTRYPLTIDGQLPGEAGPQHDDWFTRYRPVPYGALLEE